MASHGWWLIPKVQCKLRKWFALCVWIVKLAQRNALVIQKLTEILPVHVIFRNLFVNPTQDLPWRRKILANSACPSPEWCYTWSPVGKAICCRTSEEVLSLNFEKWSFEASAFWDQTIQDSQTEHKLNNKRLVGVATAKRNSFATTLGFIFPNTPFFQVQLQDTCSFAATSYRESSKGHIQIRVQRVQRVQIRVHSCLMMFDVFRCHVHSLKEATS